MKTKVLFILSMTLIAGFFFASCRQQPAQPKLVEQQITVTEPNFFYLVKETVEKGQTLWGRAKVNYGSGTKWTDIVKRNKFMQKPGRVWKDTTNGMWYALIRTGEQLTIDSTEINPVFVDINDVQAQPANQKPAVYHESDVPWWGWMILAIVVIVIVMILLIANWSRGRNMSQSQNIHVDINNGNDIDSATRASILQHEQTYRDRVLTVIENGAKEKNLHQFEINENPLNFHATAEFFKTDNNPGQ